MNVLFLTMSTAVRNISESGIYNDLMRKFRKEGHQVYILYPNERRSGRSTEMEEVDGIHLLGVRTLNVQKTNVAEKGIGQLLIETRFKHAIKRFFSRVPFDLILYSTPPITFPKVIEYVKRANPDAVSYLLLKDIFPQNAVDLGMLSKTGIKGLLYKFFRQKEKKLYALSDYIGCMSPANVEYLLTHNKELDASRIEIAPNSVELSHTPYTDRENARLKYGIPTDRPVFIYGGNLGKPQGIQFLMECLEANGNRKDCFFIVIGTGTELTRIKQWSKEKCPKSVKVMDGLPKADYDKLVRACDVGLIFLDHRFTIPNYPSRILSYLENKMPVICATDPNTDMGGIAEENGYGYWCESTSVPAFTSIIDKMINSDVAEMGQNGYDFLCKNYLVENTYQAIVKHLDNSTAY